MKLWNVGNAIINSLNTYTENMNENEARQQLFGYDEL
jgi:hypothetical protein